MPWKYNGTNIKEGRSWTSSDNVVHPSNWGIWSDDYKKSVGLTFEAEVNNSFDNRFYWSKGVAKSLTDIKEVDEDKKPILGLDGNQIVTIGLKNQYLEISKNTANDLLQETDWYVIRKAERSVDIPDNVKTYRAAILTQLEKIETAINGVSTLTNFMKLFDDTVDSDGKITAIAVVNDWPKLGS
tara:strand:+ start:138 stop:689 length:552 start_codon:yes stop_codon:yes gene_type:complete